MYDYLQKIYFSTKCLFNKYEQFCLHNVDQIPDNKINFLPYETSIIITLNALTKLYYKSNFKSLFVQQDVSRREL